MKKNLSKNEKRLILFGIKNGTKRIEDLEEDKWIVTMDLSGIPKTPEQIAAQLKEDKRKHRRVYNVTLNLD